MLKIKNLKPFFMYMQHFPYLYPTYKETTNYGKILGSNTDY